MELSNFLRSDSKLQIVSDKYEVLGAFLVAQMVKNLPAMRETQFQSPGREDPLGKEMATHSTTLGQSGMVGYSPWGLKESDTAGRLTVL